VWPRGVRRFDARPRGNSEGWADAPCPAGGTPHSGQALVVAPLACGDDAREVVRAGAIFGGAGDIVQIGEPAREVPSDGFDVGVCDPKELGTNDGRDVFERVLGPDANEVRGDFENLSEEKDSKASMRRDLDFSVELFADDRSERLPVAVR
jgi:hypothetical protein